MTPGRNQEIFRKAGDGDVGVRRRKPQSKMPKTGGCGGARGPVLLAAAPRTEQGHRDGPKARRSPGLRRGESPQPKTPSEERQV